MNVFVFTPPHLTQDYLDEPETKKHLDRLAQIKLLHLRDADAFAAAMPPRPTTGPTLTVFPRVINADPRDAG
jgi:hypothetical protein